MKKLIILLGLLCCITPVYAQDVRAIKTNESFEEVARIDHVQEIRINTMPRRQYTPTNLRTQYEMRFTGKNDTTGAMTVWSNTFTDYDTKVTGSGLEGDDYYIYDNAGQKFKTGEHIDLTPIQTSINNVINDVNVNKANIQQNTLDINGLRTDLTATNNNVSQNAQNIQKNSNKIEINRQNIQINKNNIESLTDRMNRTAQDINRLDNRINNVEQNMRSGLATVTALTSLHPNPRSDAPVELSLGTGMYKDQCAGAAGLFIHPNDWSMLQGGFAFGNSDNYAGYVGMTFSLPWFKKRK